LLVLLQFFEFSFQQGLLFGQLFGLIGYLLPQYIDSLPARARRLPQCRTGRRPAPFPRSDMPVFSMKYV